MTFHISRSEVFQALSQVRHPEFQNRNLVELSMITEVIVDKAQVQVILALPSWMRRSSRNWSLQSAKPSLHWQIT